VSRSFHIKLLKRHAIFVSQENSPTSPLFKGLLCLLDIVILSVPFEFVSRSDIAHETKIIIFLINVFHGASLPLSEIGESSLSLSVDRLVLEVVESDFYL